jgi:hypothetical protein
VGTGGLVPADILESDVSVSHFGKMLCHYSLVGCDVAYVCRLGKPVFRMVMLPLILEFQVVLILISKTGRL